MRSLRLAVRLLARQPLFTLTAVLSIAVGIGANTAIFTAVNALLFAPPPGVAAPDRVVDIGRTTRGEGFDNLGYQTFLDVRARATGFSGIAGVMFEPRPISLSEQGSSERIFGIQVSGNYFDVLGVRPHIGRLLRDDDERLGVKSPVVVLAHEFWRARFNADPDIVGRTVTLNGEPFTVLGVAPDAFSGTTILRPDVWVPFTAHAQGMAPEDLLRSRRSVFMVMIGRLADGVSLEQAQASLEAIAAQLQQEHPAAYEDRGLVATPMGVVPGQAGIVSGFMAVLMGLVGLVLMIVCVNLAGMQLARATSRGREIAVRLALGASRRQIVGQLLLESVVLCVAGGLLGLVAGRWMIAALWGLLPAMPIPIDIDFSIDWRVVGFAAVAVGAAALLTGLVPALQATRPALVPALKDAARAPARMRLRQIFVAGQLALSIVLLLAAALLVRAFSSALAIDPGFEPRGVVAASLDLNVAGYTEDSSRPFYRDLIERARTVPGVTDAAVGVVMPLEGSSFGMGGVSVPGLPDDTLQRVDWNLVSPGWFETMRLPMAAGRTFTEADREGAAPVVIVNETFAARAWPGEDAIGRRVVLEDGNRSVEVIGVARDARLRLIGEPTRAFIWVPIYQMPFLRAHLFVRHDDAMAPTAVMTPVRDTVRAINPYLPIIGFSDMADVAAYGMIPQRLAATLAGALGVAGLLLAAMGLYGLMAYGIAARTREIGIRQAIGAEPGRVVRMFVAQGMKLAAIGLAIGFALGALVAMALEGLLFGVSPFDPLAFGGTAAAMLITGLLASWLPARRAANITPLAALRAE